MKQLILCIIILCSFSKTYSQSANLQVMSAGGLSNAQIAYTIGEPLINTLSAGTTIITQGFHQTNLSILGLGSEVEKIEISVYPNPTSSMFTINYAEDLNGLYLQIFDSQGKELIKLFPKNNEQIDVTHLSVGSYIIIAKKSENQVLSRHKLVKF